MKFLTVFQVALLAFSAAASPLKFGSSVSKDGANKDLYKRLNVNDTVFLLLDLQAGLFSLVDDWQSDEFKANALGLAEASALLDIPVVLTSSVEDGPNGLLLPEAKSLQKNATYVPRKEEINAWDNAEVVQAIKETSRKQIVMAGIGTDVCVAFPALSAVQEGYEVFDASGTFNQEVRDLTLARMVQAGVQPMNFSHLCVNWPAIGEILLMVVLARSLPSTFLTTRI
ncbi:hypothetical protein K7432_015974 [Basidiobolus ranarum]|uniref:Isochorismatase-like domain-containing protein n=1 Tax=Basidiobolus ranarum TaxID=34480 RepID=A0ABR2WFF0_9FUNG